MKGVNLRCIVSTYVNITMYSPVQLLYGNKFKKTKTNKKPYFRVVREGFSEQMICAEKPK
jgi:hypothetical protein